MPANHPTVAAGPNDPTKQVSSTAWNQDHTVALTDGEHGARGASLHTDSHANTNDPTAGQKAALAGTSGTPGAGNAYVTDGDARNTNARTAVAHALVGALHTLAGGTGGFVVRAIDATSFAWARLAHSDLTIDSSHTHASTTGQTADDHHAQLHEASHELGGTDPVPMPLAPASTVTIPSLHCAVVAGRYRITTSAKLVIADTGRFAIV